MITRRAFLELSAATAALPFLPGDDFILGIQTYSLRAFDLDGTIARVKELGLKHTQFYPGHQMPATGDPAAYRKKLADAGLEIRSYGVCPFSKNHEANRKLFDFAKAMGFDVLVADPDPDAFESLVTLTNEYGVKIAIHNHGPGHRYDTLADVERAIGRRPDAIGACVDTGHFIRSGETPGKVIRALGSRVYDVHLKDALDAKTFTLLGEGRLDVRDTVAALRDVKFAGLCAIEYELNEKNPMDDLRRCVATLREALK